VIIGYLNVVGVTVLPSKADAPLIIDPNAMLPVTPTPQLLKSIARWHRQIM
jgi:hypothetical protein